MKSIDEEEEEGPEFLGELTEAEASNGLFYFKDKTRLVMVQIDDNLRFKHQEHFFKDEKV
jgi:hypothetical protein